MHTKFWSENMKGKEHFAEAGSVSAVKYTKMILCGAV
jgi:hypothetical protein